MAFAQMPLKTKAPPFLDSNNFKEKKNMNIVRIKVKFLLSSMLTLGTIIKILLYYSILFTIHSSHFMI